MPILRSIVLSLLTSAVATAVARRMLAVSGAEEHPTGLRSRRRAPVVPILTGNSNNRIGWVEGGAPSPSCSLSPASRPPEP